MRRSHALASLFALAFPGPCATFDGVAPPVEEAVDAAADAPVVDAGASPACDAGIRFEFEGDAACQDAVDENCCVFETECAGDDACVKWIACVNACPIPRTGPCVAKCGSTRDASFGNALTGLSSCRAALDAATLCSWP